jgi:hypothetical protein
MSGGALLRSPIFQLLMAAKAIEDFARAFGGKNA